MTLDKFLCTRCGINPVPAPRTIEEDPICPSCLAEVITVPAFADPIDLLIDTPDAS